MKEGDLVISSDDEAPVLEIWGVLSTSSFPLLPGPLWPLVAVQGVFFSKTADIV